MSRGPVARSLEELDDLERQNLEAGTMGEVYSPPSNTMEAINSVAVRPDDSRSNDELAAAPAVSEQHTDAKGIAKTMEPKKSQREMLADWLKEQDAMLRSMTSERERAISDAERASAGSDQGRSIINSLAAGGSILADNKDLAKGYMAQAGEMPGQQKAESDRKALAAWVAKQAEGLDSRGKLMQQAGEADERNAYLRDALAAKPPPKEPVADPLADLKGKKLEAEIYRLKHPVAKPAAQPKAPSVKANAPPTSVLTTLADIDSARNIMAELETGRPEPEGYMGRIGSVLSGKVGQTKEGQYEARKKAAAQLIGGIMEGGKLTDNDFARYLNMMPGVGDTKEQAANKANMLRSMLGSKAESLRSSFSGAGYMLPGGEQSGPVEMVGPKGEVETVEPQFVEQAKKDGWKVR